MLVATDTRIDRATKMVAVSADFMLDPKRQSVGWVEKQVLDLVEEFEGLDVCIKLGSAVDICGYKLPKKVKKTHRVVLDKRHSDPIDSLLANASAMHLFDPDFVTIMCSVGKRKISVFKNALPESTKLLGVTVPTDVDENIYEQTHGRTIREAVRKLVFRTFEPLDGFITATQELGEAIDSTNTPRVGDYIFCATNIRTNGLPVTGDEQNPRRASTPEKAVRAKANMLFIGKPILQAKDRRKALLQIINEIAEGLPR